MKKDIETKLYNDYLKGEKNAFELLYSKYKDRIKYFVYNIVKDYQKAEDITQDVFIYILQNKMKEKYDFKYYIYLIAKNRALNYINSETRKKQIDEKYFSNEAYDPKQDIEEIISKNETRQKIIEAINLLDDKYKNAIYLVKIEGFSYKETAEILDETVQNVKNLVHRGKAKLRKILVVKGFNEMNKASKILLILLASSIILSSVVYATVKIIENIKLKMIPAITCEVEDSNMNTIWVGSFQIAWNEFVNTVLNKDVDFEGEKSVLANELNKQTFTKEMLSNEDYYVKVGETSNQLKQEILKEINEKFKINKSSILNDIDFNEGQKTESYIIYSILYKKFNFIKPFDIYGDDTFNGSSEKVKYFGIFDWSHSDLDDNVEVLFYNSIDDYAVKLKTKENEDVILYLNNTKKSFESLYKELEQKTKDYNGNINFSYYDKLKVPYINIDVKVNYSDLCHKEIKGTNGKYIEKAIQNVIFSLNEKGGKLQSEGGIKDTTMGIHKEERFFKYDSPFVIFLKETEKEKPYFALRIDNTDFLVK